MSDVLHGWHFLAADGRTTGYSGGLVQQRVKVGTVLTVEPPIFPCERGLHGSIRLIDALKYAPGPILTRCAYSGEIKREGDKFAAERRKVLWIADIGEILWLASCHFAETAMRRVAWTDARSWAAVETRRKWLRGDATDAELSAAYAAASAAYATASTAYATASAASVAWRSAAWSAANAAARAASAESAASAAWSAASAAWRAASAESAASAASAESEQNEWLEAAVKELAGVDGGMR